ncbi:hypothetical protein MUP32_03855, partial [Candidatus Microgenomates bacterium]|nr:hypothetical protein [Candidatus Microgenomates bacterium]
MDHHLEFSPKHMEIPLTVESARDKVLTLPGADFYISAAKTSLATKYEPGVVLNDEEIKNEAVERLVEDVNKSLDARYTCCMAAYELGLTKAERDTFFA